VSTEKQGGLNGGGKTCLFKDSGKWGQRNELGKRGGKAGGIKSYSDPGKVGKKLGTGKPRDLFI